MMSIPPLPSPGLCETEFIIFDSGIEERSMSSNQQSRTIGRHFLHIPGPTMLPDRVLRAMDMPIIDHRGPEFALLARRVLDGLKTIVKTKDPVVIYPSSGTGAWEAALVN